MTKLNSELIDLKNNGKSQDEILHFLSKKNASILDVIVSIRALYGIKLQEAKEIVASHSYWGKIHMASEPLHDLLEKTFQISEDSQ